MEKQCHVQKLAHFFDDFRLFLLLLLFNNNNKEVSYDEWYKSVDLWTLDCVGSAFVQIDH